MRYVLILIGVLVVAIGAAGFVYGGYDDSPGLQLLSCLLVVGVIAAGVRLSRRRAR